MLFLSYNGSRSQTRLQVPSSLRREGLWVTYVLYDKTVVTEWYSAEAIDDTTFTLDIDCPGEDINNYKDTNTGSYAKIMATLNANSLTSVVVIPPTVNDESKDATINLSLKFNIPYVILPDLTNLNNY